MAADRPPGGIFAWSQQPPADAHHLNSGASRIAGRNSSQAAAILSYDVAHAVPWDWRVGLYTWTKNVSAGIYLVAAALVLSGVLDPDGALWRWAVPSVALGFLVLTGMILIWDLEHPRRFYYIFTRPQWRSWLVRGGVIIGSYGLVLSLHLLGTIAGLEGWPSRIAIVGVPLALMTAIYTAFLLAQAKGRDLWQNPLLPPHLAIQATAAGAASICVAAATLSNAAERGVGWTLFAAGLAHLLMIAGEISVPHPTAHGRVAVLNLRRGPIGRWFWLGVLAACGSLLGPVFPEFAGGLTLLGLFAYEHAFVQAGQSVPLA